MSLSRSRRASRARALPWIAMAALMGGCEEDEPELTGNEEIAVTCTLSCKVELACTGRDLSLCVFDCSGAIVNREPPRTACEDARLVLGDCQVELSCEELDDLANGDANPCSSEAEEVEARCD